MRHWRTRFTICCLLLFLCALPSSCVDKDLYEPKEEKEIETGYVKYLYHYAGEARDVVADITIKTNSEINAESVVIEIPVLKFNKSWLFMLTQDDHRHSAYSTPGRQSMESRCRETMITTPNNLPRNTCLPMLFH